MLLLDALEAARKPVTYYALDLSYPELESTLDVLSTRKYQSVQCRALHGTFEDGLHWMKETPEICSQPHCVLLFGLTIGNFSRPNASKFLCSIAAHAMKDSPSGSAILLTLDGCQESTKLLRGYRAEGVDEFALASLSYANTLFGEEGSKLFKSEDWKYHSEWNAELGRHEASLMPREQKDITLGSPLETIVVKGDEKVRFGCSYKYGAKQRQELWAEAGVRETKVWSNENFDVAFYLLSLY
jgi:4-dimethylallyltryptophan N-methyltransferase